MNVTELQHSCVIIYKLIEYSLATGREYSIEKKMKLMSRNLC